MMDYHISSHWKIKHITMDCHYKKSVHLITLFLTVKSSLSYYLISHIANDSVFCFSNIFIYPKDISICDNLHNLYIDTTV
jgi:hypothetical protein